MLLAVHGDLRSPNVLIDSHGIAFLSDFGMSKIVKEVLGDSVASTSLTGTNIRWMAKELFMGNPKITTSSDVWSYGILCLEVMTGTLPFSGWSDSEVTIRVDNGELPSRPGLEATMRGLSDALWELMESCWNPEPRHRPCMQKIYHGLGILLPSSPTIRTNRPSILEPGRFNQSSPVPSLQSSASTSSNPSQRQRSSTISTHPMISPAVTEHLEPFVSPKRPHVTLNSSKDQLPISGNVEGLLDMLAHGAGFADIFLTCHAQYITGEHLLDLIKGMFEQSHGNPRQQFFLLVVIEKWIEHHFIDRTNTSLLSTLRTFLLEVISTSLGNDTMATAQRAKELVNQKLFPSQLQRYTGNPKSPSEAELAATLIVLEGNHYKRILPGDCINFLFRTDSSPTENPYGTALAVNKTITSWVMKAIIVGGSWQERAARYQFFLETAKLCKQSFKKFSSMFAIVDALQSKFIEGMEVTQKAVAKCRGKLDKMSSMAAKDSYTVGLRMARLGCVPRLYNPGILPNVISINTAMHPLDDSFRQVLNMEDTISSSDGEHLINFRKWAAAVSHVDKILQYQLPFNVPADDGASAYLADQLSRVLKSCESELAGRASRIHLEERPEAERIQRQGLYQAFMRVFNATTSAEIESLYLHRLLPANQ